MASGVASSTRRSSLPATVTSSTRGASQPPSDAPLVEHAQERRQTLGGEFYTLEEFIQHYGVGKALVYWNRAVREAAPPGASQPGLSPEGKRRKLRALGVAAEPAASSNSKATDVQIT